MSQSPLEKEIEKRRTFAIISHPDAGKTTLTEKLLLYGGGIREAGAVRSNKIERAATSDFLEIERQRGISVATSVMSFEYADKIINILDTPGHKDFAEDTYRTLTAVDSVILIVDSAKGVEEQTERLMEVCRMRDTPVIIFVNKLDREGRSPFELMDELEEKLQITVRPLTWPIGQGDRFKGVYNLLDQNLYLFRAGSRRTDDEDRVKIESLDDPRLEERIGEFAEKLREEAELVDGVYPEFERSSYLNAQVAPVFFGSALNNFGVKELLETFLNISPAPLGRETDARRVESDEDKFSGFIFKIHANLDPKHRDRIAFLRVCSGVFERNKMFHHVRLNKRTRFSNPYSFMAARKNVVDEAYPGDVVGLYDRGDLKIGDTLTEGEEMMYQGIPSFSPEVFRQVYNADPIKYKQFEKGLQQLTEEGLAQLFIQDQGKKKILGTVGSLQLDVIQHRLTHEYGAQCRYDNLPYYRACWLTSENKEKLDEFIRFRMTRIANDKDKNIVWFASSPWELQVFERDNPEIEFHTTSEFKLRRNS